MSQTYDLILKNGTLVTPGGEDQVDVAVRGEKIVAIGKFDESQAGETYDATGLHILPGVIDSQVHFREPGLTHKADLETEARSAALGGVTATCASIGRVCGPMTSSRIAGRIDSLYRSLIAGLLPCEMRR